MTITYLDPRATPSAAIEPYAPIRRHRSTDDPLTIGLLANGFPDSDNFTRLVGEALLRKLPADTRSYFLNKGNASAPATQAQVDGMAAEVHVVVTAYGH
jgi:hypothetical protein